MKLQGSEHFRTRFPGPGVRIVLSLASYLAASLVLGGIALLFVWTPLSSLLPMALYGLSFALFIWIWGVWLLVAGFSKAKQLQHSVAVIEIAGLHGLLIVGISYWVIYGRNADQLRSQLDWRMLCFFLFIVVACSLSAAFYIMLLRRLSTRLLK